MITQRLAALAGYGLIAEDGVGPSTGGRAPRRLRFRADAGYLLVADLGATSINVAVADLGGDILARRPSPPTSPRSRRGADSGRDALRRGAR